MLVADAVTVAAVAALAIRVQDGRCRCSQNLPLVNRPGTREFYLPSRIAFSPFFILHYRILV